MRFGFHTRSTLASSAHLLLAGHVAALNRLHLGRGGGLLGGLLRGGFCVRFGFHTRSTLASKLLCKTVYCL